MKLRRCFAVALVIGAACGGVNAADAGYPARPVRLISPITPGGGNDFVLRAVTVAMTRNIGQSVVVDNRPGANTIAGMEIVEARGVTAE